MTKTSGSFVRLGVFTALLLAVAPSLGRAEVTLATAVASRFPGAGGVKCSAVNVGDDPLDITVSLIDVLTGVVEVTKPCTGDVASDTNPGAVAPSQRCDLDSNAGATSVLFCKIAVDVKGGSGTTPNPALALLRQKVRGNIISFSANRDAFVAQAAE